MKKHITRITFTFFLGAALISAGCSVAPRVSGEIYPDKLIDGTYEGNYRYGPNKAQVKVTIKDGIIEKVELVKYFASPKGTKANEIIPQRIVERQSADVDAVTGATNSSRVIMNAAQEAINQAYEENIPEELKSKDN